MEEEMVVPEVVEETTEAPDAGGVSAETTAPEPSVDAPKPTVAPQDIDNLRSSYDKKLSEAQARESQWQAYLESLRQEQIVTQRRLYEAETKDMDEQSKQFYTLQMQVKQYEAQLQQIQEREQQREMEAQAYAQREQKIRAFSEMTGIPFSDLDAKIQTPQDLAKAFQDHYQSLKSAAGKAPPTAPKVSVAKPGSPARGMVDKINIHNPESYRDIIERAALEGIPASEL